MCRRAHVEVPCVAANDLKLSQIRRRKTTGHHPTQVSARLQKNNVQSFLRSGVRRDHAGRSAAINSKVNSGRCLRRNRKRRRKTKGGDESKGQKGTVREVWSRHIGVSPRNCLCAADRSPWSIRDCIGHPSLTPLVE